MSSLSDLISGICGTLKNPYQFIKNGMPDMDLVLG